MTFFYHQIKVLKCWWSQFNASLSKVSEIIFIENASHLFGAV